MSDTRTRARATDPHTSHEAAERASDLAPVHYREIGAALKRSPGTIYSLAWRTGLSHVQVARRLPEMQKLGLAEPTGETAPSPWGRACRVWGERQLQRDVGE